ncbi:adenosylcobinamide-phosphate synthase [Sinobacterium caligoides]|uniref:Cobalamin biosynthesis protein CobD n=1 Tax=Sinobacterium caligoides TaxID=933926 RepID=A0A3N2DQ57_9GAMM|nr:adenosylcobinamide-phosphate synthase CbiB [Sinobacterium caligoides]ROS01920.1 adenosylcobinamide-phosphate synthase [Sinobacterium caligoides]
MFEFSMALWAVVMGLLLDYLFGEVRRYHPLVGLGIVVRAIEHLLCRSQPVQRGGEDSYVAPSKYWQRACGVLAVLLVLLPVITLAVALQYLLPSNGLCSLLVAAVAVYFAVGCRSLVEHAQAISKPLLVGDLEASRVALSMIVSRDTSECDEREVAAGTVESVLENGSDAVIAPLCWFLLLGIPGVLGYRVINTLDAMWGYKNDRYCHFGWCAARLDDVANLLPARLCALAYALCGQTRVALRCWWRQAKHYKSPNGGPVMASGAGAIGVVVGGEATYFGSTLTRTSLGEGRPAIAQDIDASVDLLLRSIAVWLLLLAPFALL